VGVSLGCLALIFFDMLKLNNQEYNTSTLCHSAIFLFLSTIPLFLLFINKIKIGIVDYLLVIMVLLYTLSSVYNDTSELFLYLIQESFPFILIYLSVKVLYCSNDYYTTLSVVFLAGFSIIFESFFCLEQLLGCQPSNHSAFLVTGHFSNPGPLGGYAAICTTVVLSYCFSQKIQTFPCVFVKQCKVKVLVAIRSHLFGIIIFLGLLIIALSGSRAAVVSLTVAILHSIIHRPKVTEFLTDNRLKILKFTSIVSVFVAILTGLFFIKKDSALGRIHMWEIETRSIIKHPLTGTGPGLSLGTYANLHYS